MKITKWLFVSGFLAALALAGCFNPVSSPPSGSNPAAGSDTETALLEPFTVTLHIDADGSARAAAGPNGTVIGSGGICNFMQLAVLDPAAGKVHALTDARQENAAQKNATLQVEKIVYEKDYEFLLLMGHWDRDYGKESSGGNYKYVEDHLPTLLAAGHTTARINLLNNTVNITMYPLVVDTKFTSDDNAITVNTVKDGVFSLLPGTWKLIWEVTQGKTNTDGFEKLLAVQKTDPLFKDISAQVGGSKHPAGISSSGNIFTLEAGQLVAGAGGYANFNLAYVPFSLNTADKWNGFTGLNKKAGLPEWIIRNGINDLAQNDKTDFTAPNAWNSTKNGNGAAGFRVLDPDRDEDNDLYSNGDEIRDGYDPMDPASRPHPPVMVLVGGGTFQMGSTTGNSNEKPIHTVTVTGFYMGKYEVTQKEWREVMRTTVSQQRDMYDMDAKLFGEGDNYPMYYVSWEDAAAYCNALSAKESLTPAYHINGTTITRNVNATGYRLPTEAEWEYAARGGNHHDPYEYSGSNDVTQVAWYYGDQTPTSHPVGTKQANSLGLYDMSGNEWEWCGDWWESYGNEAQTNPTGAASGTYRIVRGGDWYSNPANVRCTWRHLQVPSFRHNAFGFRVMRPW
ncbi:MAG: formylglycine-generating enzyme family protein [Spirochaetaceae bacterium]|jgi:formylglycine-generating enzyme required for sulfatase activity|nr:formylglycine-generating enzyme family protein [Spirochaetaceae bacterium]